MDSLKTVKLEEDDVIDVCTDLLYSGKYKLPPVDKQMLKICWNFALAIIVMKTHDGFYCQIDDLAMGSPQLH